MRDNPNPTAEPDQVAFRGDNVVRVSGEVRDFAELQVFAWEAGERGQEDVHIQATPSLAEHMHQQFKLKKEQEKSKLKEALLQIYGGDEHLNATDKWLIFAQTDRFVEYSRVDGKVVLKGLQEEKYGAQSKYDEDVCIKNHTSVWGSYWENGRWGYSCCKQLVMNSYCTGAAGRAAKENALKELLVKSGCAPPPSSETRTTTHKQKKSELMKKKKSKRRSSDSDDGSSSFSSSSNRDEEGKGRAKRKYNSTKDCSVTEEEMEEYHRKRLHREDPLWLFAAKSRDTIY